MSFNAVYIVRRAAKAVKDSFDLALKYALPMGVGRNFARPGYHEPAALVTGLTMRPVVNSPPAQEGL